MATAAETALANLDLALVNATARLAEIDSVPVDQRVRFRTSVGDITYDWDGYRRSLQDQIKGYKDHRESILVALGPVTSVGHAGSY